jgi:hypothetical protein
MGFFGKGEKEASPSSEYPDAPYGDYPQTGEYDDDLHVQCPPHTTERKIVRRIDFHVIPYVVRMADHRSDIN